MNALAAQEATRRETTRIELAERIAGAVPEDGVMQPVPGLFLTRASEPGRTVHGVSRPSLCVIAQGAKDVYLGDRRFA